jgi:DNA-binding HxlR family transcriptional regulator
MKKKSFAQMRCSLARSLDVIGDWWTPLIVRDVFLGVCRFDDLAVDLGISRNLLTRRLGELVRRGILIRQRYQSRPARYEYRLGDAGRDLVPALLALTAWGDRWVAPEEGPPMRFRHGPCGHVVEAAVTCSDCGAPLTADEIVALPGPGGARALGTMVVADLLSRRCPA